MGETARAEIPTPSPCEKCAGPCDVEVDGGKARLACRSCGHAFEVALVRAAMGTWTVVDPEGIVRRFSSWQELIASLPIATTPYAGGVDDRSTRASRPSAAALLDVTPAPSSVAPGAPRLSLVPGDDPPPLPRRARSQPPARGVDAIEDLPEDDIVPASDEITARMPPVRVSMPPPLPAAASMRPPAPAASKALAASPAPAASKATALSHAPAASNDPSEPPPPPALPPPPLAPKGGTLRTLPPPARRDLPAPPPPTIEVEGTPTSARADKSSNRPAASAKTAPPSARASATTTTTTASSRSTSAPPPASASDPARASASRSPPRAAEPAASRWFLPFVAVGILALGFAYVRRSSPSDSEPNGAGTGAGAGTSTTSVANGPPAASAGAPPGIPSASNPTSASSASSASSAAAVSSAALEAKPATTTGSIPERAPVGDSQLALPELLERAGAARKSGDAPHAKALLERALVLSPGNAEAHGLLGDLARAQGDQAGAKAGYEKALATSPSYYPALLGLADAEWDLGERDASQRHYIAIIGLGRSAPDRVKERALGAASSGKPTATGAGTSTAASTTTPPTSTATSGTSESAPSPP
jgi:hypothetical protein